ncbi:hypothetical protein HK105_202743 [Polyrhizophydium stewartii]|uniref:Uncharacterized protein n=1 Tax=Polyrhizophydium stewartii TaxID=2732419 RepID=A0ABR4NEA1_9FUNG
MLARKQALFLHRQALRQYRPSPTPSDQRQLKMLLDQLDEDDNDDMWVDEAHAFGYPSLAPPAAVAASLAAAGPAAPSAGPAAASNSATPDPAASAVEASLGTGSSAASIPEYSEWLESVHASSFVAPAVLEAGLARAHAVPVAVAAPRPTSQLSQPPARSSAPETSAAIYPSGTLGRTMSADHLQEQLLRQLSLQQQQQHELLSAHADSIYSIPKNTHVTGSIGPAKSAWKLGGLKYVPREESKRIRVAAQQRRKAHRDSHQQSTISRLSTSRGTTSRRRDRRRSVHRSVISSMGASGEMSAGVTSSNFESFHAW